MAAVFTLVGDLVGSRRSSSRRVAQDRLSRALAEVARVVPPVDRLEPTVGDEFQGVFDTLADATLAAVLVRLELGPEGDARCGIGAGDREVFDHHRRPMLQDGPAWWNARAAIDVLGQPAHRLHRTWLVTDDDRTPADVVNAFLLTRDALVDRLGPRSRTMLARSLAGQTQRQIATSLAISESAVSQAFARGVGAVREAQAVLAAESSAPATRSPATGTPARGTPA